jgi:uncharacterized membrane protein required for colicin V production
MPSLPGGFSWIDLVIVLVVGGGIYVGYSQGLLRQLVGLGALYLAAILAAQNYLPLSEFINRLFQLGLGRFVNVVCFLIIFFGVATIINLIAAEAYRMTKFKIAPTLDVLSGSILGFITVILLLVFLIPVVRFVSGEPFPYIESARSAILQGLQTSRFVPLILSYRPLLLSTLTPWLPGGLPAIFD